MGAYVANKTIKQMIKKGLKINNANVLVLGITFKENCPDIRNSKVIDIINELKEFGCNVDIFDPWADKGEVLNEYNLDLKNRIEEIDVNKYSGVILAVAHNEFKNLDFLFMRKTGAVIFDVKGVLNKDLVDGRL